MLIKKNCAYVFLAFFKCYYKNIQGPYIEFSSFIPNEYNFIDIYRKKIGNWKYM